MDDQTLIKAFLKKQKEIQDEFLAKLNQYRAPVDTAELKRLVEDYKTVVYGAANIKPKLDTSTIDQTIKQAVSNAISTVSLSSLTDEVKTQARAIERNNSLLSNGTGWQLKFWIILLTLVFGFMAGWGVNWYFKIPAQLTDNYKLQYHANRATGYLKYINSSCKTKQAYAKWSNQSIDCDTQSWSLD